MPFGRGRWDLEFGYVRVPVGEVFVVGVCRVPLGIGSFWCAGVREEIFGGTGFGVFPCSLFHPGWSFDGGRPVFGVSGTTRVTDGFTVMVVSGIPRLFADVLDNVAPARGTGGGFLPLRGEVSVDIGRRYVELWCGKNRGLVAVLVVLVCLLL